MRKEGIIIATIRIKFEVLHYFPSIGWLLDERSQEK